MATFNEYFPLIQSRAGSSPVELARIIRRDPSLQEWQRKTLLLQLRMTVDRASRESITPAYTSPAPYQTKDLY